MVKSGERHWVVYFAAVVMLATTLPYVLGYASQGADWRFTGFIIGVEDGNSYIAKMLTGAAGAWLFRSPYSTLPQNGALVFLPYLLLGKLASAPGLHEQLVALFHLFRIVAGMLAILVTYEFIAFFVDQVKLRRLALALAILGGGLGWVLLMFNGGMVFGSIPLDIYSPETFGFLELFGLPHLCLARAGLLGGLLLYLRGIPAMENSARPGEGGLKAFFSFRLEEVKRILGLALIGIATWIAQPVTAALLFAIIGIHLGFTLLWRLARKVETPTLAGLLSVFKLPFWAGLLVLPFFLYSLLSFQLDAYLKGWAAQNKIYSPNPLHYLFAYGWLLPLIALGAVKFLRRGEWAFWLPVGWLVALPIMVYAPFIMQRRLAEGVWVAFCVLAVSYWEREGEGAALPAAFKRFAPYYAVVFPSTLVILLMAFLAAANPQEPVFVPTQEVAAFEQIAAKAQKFDVVLAAYPTGNALPAWATVRVVTGHTVETANFDQIDPQAAAFFDPATPQAERMAILGENDVSFVLWGPAERALGSWDPRQASFLRSVGEAGEYDLLEVDPPVR